MLEQAAAFADGPITTAVIELAFGATGRNYANTLVDAVVARDAAAVLRTIEEASDAGADMVVLTRSLIANFRNLLVALIDPDLLARDLAPEDAEIAAERAIDVPQATIVRALRVLADAASLARTGANPRLELETALLRFLLEEGDGGAAPSGRRTPVEKAPPKAPPELVIPSVAPPIVTPGVAPKERSRGAASDAGPITVQRLRAAWTSIRGKVEAERPPLRAPLSGAMVDSIDGNAVVLKLRAKFDADILKEHTKLLESAIADVLGAPLHVRLESGASAPAVTAEPTPVNEEESADELFGYANERIK
jgi:DNA polymerase III gamma/tau subunit